MKLFKEIFKLIKKYNNIVIARHIGADPDALGSQFALKELIKENFSDKSVYAVGSTASKFRFMGCLDKPEEMSVFLAAGSRALTELQVNPQNAESYEI